LIGRLTINKEMISWFDKQIWISLPNQRFVPPPTSKYPKNIF
jgi:hypothetical protein